MLFSFSTVRCSAFVWRISNSLWALSAWAFSWDDFRSLMSWTLLLWVLALSWILISCSILLNSAVCSFLPKFWTTRYPRARSIDCLRSWVYSTLTAISCTWEIWLAITCALRPSAWSSLSWICSKVRGFCSLCSRRFLIGGLAVRSFSRGRSKLIGYGAACIWGYVVSVCIRWKYW